MPRTIVSTNSTTTSTARHVTGCWSLLFSTILLRGIYLLILEALRLGNYIGTYVGSMYVLVVSSIFIILFTCIHFVPREQRHVAVQALQQKLRHHQPLSLQAYKRLQLNYRSINPLSSQWNSYLMIVYYIINTL